MKMILVTALLATACAHAPSSGPLAPAARLATGGGFEVTLPFPNGIASAPDGRVWVGSVTSGTILEISPDGTSRVLFDGDESIGAGTALRFDASSGRLWGVAPDLFGRPRLPSTVFAIDVDTGTVALRQSLPAGAFANDLALDGSGGAYITDSLSPQVLHVDSAGGVSTFVEDPRFAVASGELGLSGIARFPDGALVVGHFTSGKLFRIRPQRVGAPVVDEIRLSRSTTNPDGMLVVGDDVVLLCEGNLAGNHGRLLRLDFGEEGLAARVDVVRDDLESPVNLTRDGDTVLVSDARIRARMRGEPGPEPTSFPIVRVALPGD